MAENKGGRPPIKVQPSEILMWAKTGATHEEIAQRLGISLSTLQRRFRTKKYQTVLMVGRGELKISLRAKQVQVALAGNVQMLKFLGVNYLGQAEAHRIVDEEGKDRPIVDVSPIELLNTRIASIIERKREGGGPPGV